MIVASSQDLQPPRAENTLGDAATKAVRRYLRDLNGSPCADLYGLMLRQVEYPLLQEALRHCNGNLTRTAELLGINRATLRKKLADFGIGN